jgi:ribosomal protein S18 acetylase RimI-like enzyme
MNNPSPKNAHLLRCLSFLRDVQCATATEIIDTPVGAAFFNADFPDKHDLNVYWVHRLDPQVDAKVFIREVERVQEERGLRYRRLILQDKTALEALKPVLQSLAWIHSSNVLMTKDAHGLISAPDKIAVKIVARAQLDDHIFRWYLNEEGLTSDEAAMLLNASRGTEGAVPTLYLAAVLGGKLAGWCEVRILGTTAQLENLGTLREYRRRGVGSALVRHAVNLSYGRGAEVIFLRTDATDNAQHLYARLGFVEVGALHRFMKYVT